MTINCSGVMPAITTCFKSDLTIDHEFLSSHAHWLISNGCSGIVALGSLGEGAALEADEKRACLETFVAALGGTAPVVAAVSALSTSQAVELARTAARVGCAGLMVLPPYVYGADWCELKAHVAAVFACTDLPCMLYNNPIAYGADFLPHQIAELAGAHANLVAVKESSADVRRITALRALMGDRLQLCVGVDDAIVEGVAAGAVGWIAGLANAFPCESVRLFELALAGDKTRVDELYRWFLPLLRMDTVPKFVQLIKLVQAETGMGSTLVRGPRLALQGAELDVARRVIAQALATRPALD